MTYLRTIPTLAAASLLATALTAPARADTVLKDHVTISSLWNNVSGFGDFDFNGSNNDDGVAAACFTGNGGTLTSMSGIFYKAANGIPNAGTWNAFAFRFIFYSTVSVFQTNPFTGSAQHVYTHPVNSNWLTPVGNWGAYQLFRFDFDLAGLGIQTAAGQVQLAAIQTAGDGFSGGVGFMCFSTGGAGAIGTELDWYRNNTMGWGPATFQSLGAPHNFIAARITATTPPCPADLGSTGGMPGPDGVLDNNDFIVFIDAFFAHAPTADRGSQGGVHGSDGAFDNNDFIVFIDQFFAGC